MYIDNIFITQKHNIVNKWNILCANQYISIYKIKYFIDLIYLHYCFKVLNSLKIFQNIYFTELNETKKRG